MRVLIVVNVFHLHYSRNSIAMISQLTVHLSYKNYNIVELSLATTFYWLRYSLSTMLYILDRIDNDFRNDLSMILELVLFEFVSMYP